ncbi:MAG: FecR domain-containing protein [Verrucomicrobia bacterium]|nr:FecR domain-containing protein [Verrucomicrobiota bacterium]
MTDARYQELLARLLDQELSAAEADELAATLRTNPQRAADIRQHLALWDLYSQDHAAERSAHAFELAWRTRLAAEADAADFVAQTTRQFANAPGAGAAQACSPAFRRSADIRRADRLKAGLPTWNWRSALALAASVVLLLGLGVWYFGPTIGEPVLVDVKGTGVSVERGTEFVAAIRGMRLLPGDVLRIGTNASVGLAFGAEQTRIDLESETELKLISFASGKRLQLRSGKLEAAVARQRLFRPMIVTTPNAQARVLGTQFTLKATTSRTELRVDEGKVRLTDTRNGEAEPVPAGYYAVVAAATKLAALPQTGSIFREYWTNLPGKRYDTDLTIHPAFPDHPNEREWLNRLETPNGWGDDYGARWRGFLHPPGSGDYRMSLAASDDAGLYLSPDDQPENKVKVLMSRINTVPQDYWQSESPLGLFGLKAGHRYHIEVIHKAGKGPDHLSVTWKRPDGKIEIIPGEYLSPFKPKPKEANREKR